MRRGIALVLSILMITLLVFPTWVFAQTEEESGLENVIKIVKRKFDVPEDFKFEYYNIYENPERGEKVWNLSWYDKEKERSLYVGTTEEGKITSYNYNEPYKEVDRKFPVYKEEEALKKAEDFIRWVSPPGTLSKINKYHMFQNPIVNRNKFYNFNYYRIVNGIPFYQDNLNVNVNTETGEIHSYNYNLNDKLIFPDIKDAISMEIAQDKYKENLGLKLIYQHSYDYRDEKINVFPVFVPKYDNNTYAIDAITGEKLLTNRYGVYGYLEGAVNQSVTDDALNIKRAAGLIEEPSLTPDELEAVEKQLELISKEEAEKIVREIPENELGEEFLLRNWSLNRGWPVKENFIYNMSFRKEVEMDQARYLYADATVNAKTGEVLSFYVNYPYNEEEARFDEDSAREAAEEYLKSFVPEKYEEVELEKREEEIYIDPNQEPKKYFYFNYVRKVNDILFPGNGINVGFDAVNGKVTNYSVNWFDIEFPGLEDTVSFEKAHEALFENIGLELQYKQVGQEDDFIPMEKQIPETTTSLSEKKISDGIKAVYLLKSGKPFILDAYTGNIIDYEGKPYREEKLAEYKDVEGHYAEEKIKELAKYGIINFTGKEYKPDEEILQKDFFSILIKVIDRYYGPIILEDSHQTEIDEMYKQLMREGVVKENEKDPESAVTREDAVKFIIRALKYDKIADIGRIFKVIFVDSSEIDPKLLGYVAIANGLEIVSGVNNRFKPKDNLTRAEGAVMIYNYLKR